MFGVASSSGDHRPALRRVTVSVIATLGVLLAGVAAYSATGQQSPPFDGPMVAVAVIDGQMELTRRQVVVYGLDDAKTACADAAWRPEMHHALAVLLTDRSVAPVADDWGVAWSAALVACYRGDMASANGHIVEAYRLRDVMVSILEFDNNS